MTDSRAYDPDRLPWLADEPRPRRFLTMVATLAGVLLATLLLAGVSYWLGMQSAGRPVNFGPVDFRPVDFWNDWRTAPAATEAEPAAAPRPAAVEQLPAPGVQRAANSPAVSPPIVDSPAASQPAPTPPSAPVERPAEPRLTPVKPPPSPALPAAPQARTAGKPPAAEPDAGAAAASAVQSRASFNCRLARTRGEIAVCSNGELGALDRNLAALTSQALKRADAAKRAQLARTRVRFLARRDACSSDSCTSALYLDRMREVSAIAGGPANTPPLGASPPAAQVRAAPKPQAAQPQARPVAKPPVAQREARASAATLDPKSRASFSCRFARTRGEITVCNSAELGRLDRQLAVLYGFSWGRADAIKRARLLRTRNRFLAQREACRSEACVNALYVARMREVSVIGSGTRPPR